MQDYGSLGVVSITDRKRLFQVNFKYTLYVKILIPSKLIQTLREHQNVIVIPPSPNTRDFSVEPNTTLSFAGLRTPQQQKSRLKFPIKNNMVGLSSVSYMKKSASKELPSSIPTSMSSPRVISSRSPMIARKQAPSCIRKQQDEPEEDDEREIVSNHGLLNPYGIPTANPSSYQRLKKSDLNQKIRVCVRKRPLSKKEVERSEKDITPAQSCRTIHVNEPK